MSLNTSCSCSLRPHSFKQIVPLNEDNCTCNCDFYVVGKSLEDMSLDELNEKEDDIDEEEERIFEEYR